MFAMCCGNVSMSVIIMSVYSTQVYIAQFTVHCIVYRNLQVTSLQQIVSFFSTNNEAHVHVQCQLTWCSIIAVVSSVCRASVSRRSEVTLTMYSAVISTRSPISSCLDQYVLCMMLLWCNQSMWCWRQSKSDHFILWELIFNILHILC